MQQSGDVSQHFLDNHLVTGLRLRDSGDRSAEDIARAKFPASDEARSLPECCHYRYFAPTWRGEVPPQPGNRTRSACSISVFSSESCRPDLVITLRSGTPSSHNAIHLRYYSPTPVDSQKAEQVDKSCGWDSHVYFCHGAVGSGHVYGNDMA